MTMTKEARAARAAARAAYMAEVKRRWAAYLAKRDKMVLQGLINEPITSIHT